MHRRVARERERGPLDDVLADAEGLDPVDEVADLSEAVDCEVVGRIRDVLVALGAIELCAPCAEHAAESVEAGVPVVVAGDAEESARLAVERRAKHLVEGDDDAVVDLDVGRDRVSGVAAEEEDLPARKDELPSGGIGIVDLVLRGDQLRDRLAQREVVSRVGDEVDPQVVVERLGERLRVGTAGADGLGEPARERPRRVGLHPVARVDVLGRDDARREVPEMAPERLEAEPRDRARPALAASIEELWRVLGRCLRDDHVDLTEGRDQRRPRRLPFRHIDGLARVVAHAAHPSRGDAELRIIFPQPGFSWARDWTYRTWCATSARAGRWTTHDIRQQRGGRGRDG